MHIKAKYKDIKNQQTLLGQNTEKNADFQKTVQFHSGSTGQSAIHSDGDDAKGVRGFARILMPVFQDTLDRSLALANSMDARGYGRQAHVSKFQQRVTSIFGALGILGVTVGLFVVLDA